MTSWHCAFLMWSIKGCHWYLLNPNFQDPNRVSSWAGYFEFYRVAKSHKQVYLFGPHFDLYQSLNRLPIWNSQNCSMFPMAFVAGWLQGHWWGFISRNYVVWPKFLLMNVFTALKGSHFRFLFLVKRIIWPENCPLYKCSQYFYGKNWPNTIEVKR